MDDTGKLIDETLAAAGVKDFDDLREDERATYFKMLEIAESGKITLEDYKRFVVKMRESVELALSTEALTPNQDLFLKARLKNYILMEAFFNRPERAKEILEQYKKAAMRKAPI